MKIRYVGSFPPPYGGVTIKNQLLYEELSKCINICRFRQSRWMPKRLYQIINSLLALIPGQILLIGISSKGGKSLQQTKMLYFLNRNSMKRSIYFMMGGQEADRIAADKKQVQMYRQYKQIYVETLSMKKRLTATGMSNVSIFPNCRKRSEINSAANTKRERLRCVFFSLIQEKKGVDNILIAAKEMPGIDFAFYGHIDSGYREHFIKSYSGLPNVQYMGVFSGGSDDIYRELSKFDVVLLPTMWKTEGVPGILIEAKIAGLTCIVSNECYNVEIIKDGEEGIVLEKNTAEKLAEAIKRLDLDRELLNRLKINNKISAEKYHIENYVKSITEKIVRGGENALM